MAKSASETKVEDILSSVRRLVSEETPRNERPALPEGPGALVLTDKQRIESNAAVRIAGRSLEERIAELEAAVGDTANDDEFEPDGSEDQAMHRPDRIVYTRPPQAEETDAMRRNTLRLSQIALIDTAPDEEGAAGEDDAASSDVPLQFRRDGSSRTLADTPEAPMAEDVKETLTAAEVHVFTSPDDEIDRITARLNSEPMPEPIALPKKPAAEEAAPAVDKEGGQKFDILNQVVGAMKGEKIEAKEEPPKESVDPLVLQPEASDAAFEADLEEAVSASVDPDEKAASLELVTADAADDEDASETASGIDETADETAETTIAEEAIEDAVVDILDEEDLRPIVARLIREELQGELGEQITRNVRKLVRREILRALAARDAE